MQINILDSTHCEATQKLIPKIRPCLQYKQTYWRQGPFRKVQKITTNYLITKKGLFLTGLLPRVETYLKSQKIDFFTKDFREKIIPNREAWLPDFDLKTKQTTLQIASIDKLIEAERGVIQFPTGFGKSIIALLFISRFTDKKILFLCHRVDLVNQFYESLKKYKFKNIARLNAGEKFNRITLSTIQTFANLNPKEYSDYFDIVIVDEVHHVNSLSCQYAKVLKALLAPIKVGFTATLPETKEKRLFLEGLIGPVVDKLDIQTGVDLGVLSKPKVKLIPVPYNTKISSLKKYQEIYQAGIVENRQRNLLIVREAKEQAKEEKSCLITVQKIQHGNEIVKLAKLLKLDIEFVQGGTSNLIREKTKELLSQKKRKVVISTVIWNEGINIPSLNVVIKADAGKDEKRSLQTAGRGLRTTEDKRKVLIVDFLDPYKYLAEHAIKRIATYTEAGWL